MQTRAVKVALGFQGKSSDTLRESRLVSLTQQHLQLIRWRRPACLAEIQLGEPKKAQGERLILSLPETNLSAALRAITLSTSVEIIYNFDTPDGMMPKTVAELERKISELPSSAKVTAWLDILEYRDGGKKVVALCFAFLNIGAIEINHEGPDFVVAIELPHTRIAEMQGY